MCRFLDSNNLESPLPPFLQDSPDYNVNLRYNNFDCPVPTWCGKDGSSLCLPCNPRTLFTPSTSNTISSTPSTSKTISSTSSGSKTNSISSTQSQSASISPSASISLYPNQTFNNVIVGYTETSTDPLIIIVTATLIIIIIGVIIGLSFINCSPKKKIESTKLLINEENDEPNDFKPPGPESSIQSHYWFIVIIGILVDMLGLTLIPNIFLLTLPQVNCDGVGQPKIEFIFTVIFIFISIVSGVILDYLNKLTLSGKKKFPFYQIFKISLFILLLCRVLEVVYSCFLYFFDIFPYWILYIIGIISQFSISTITYTCWNILKIKIAIIFKLHPKEETKLINKM